MKKKYGAKTILASILVTLALASPAVLVTVTPTPVAELYIRGAQLRNVMVDGAVTVQATFSVSIDKVANATGASFFLEYNPDYLLPSDAGTNEVLDVPVERCDSFFTVDPELYYKEDTSGVKTPVNPFDRNHADMSYVDLSEHVIHMGLWLDRDSKSGDGIITTTGGPSGTVLYAGDGTTKVGEIGGKIGLLEDVGYGGDTIGETTGYVMNLRQTKDDLDDTPAGEVTLGTISFQVNKEHLAEMVAYFDGLDVARSHDPSSSSDYNKKPWVKTASLDGDPQETFLLDMTQQYSDADDPWTVGHYRFVERGEEYIKDFETLKPDEEPAMADQYQFDFDNRFVVDVEVTDPDVTVNAYQNFTSGKKSDLPLTMGRYSPMVTVTYADGSKENFPFPWGRAGDDYTVKQVSTYYTQADVDTWKAANPTLPEADCPFAVGDEKATAAVTDGNYDPTHGTYYFSQLYKWTTQEPDATSATGYKTVTHTFPVPVTAKLTVTPITVIAVTAEDLERSYKVTDVVSQVPDAKSLGLPDYARIVTDIVPGGVSLRTKIPGWMPVQPASALDTDPDGDPTSGDETYTTVSTWPDAATSALPAGQQMNSLKADSYVMPQTPPVDADKEGRPYWPDQDDQVNLSDHPEYFVGTYRFVTSKADHATRQDILSSAIKADYPWLTIPFKAGSTTDRVESWDVGGARRNILNIADYNALDPTQYEVVWVDTTTETATTHGQTPDNRSNGQGQPTLRLAVYKRSGTGRGKMATGSVFRVWLPNGMELGTGQSAGGVTVDNWFNNSADTDPATVNDHVNGFYTAQGSSAAADVHFFYLSTNPDQPEVNEHGTQRETLRRYINLGGWYYVSVCEDPGAGDHWSEQLSVYVPPRRNEYTQSKIYNFLGENRSLYTWPGGVGDTLYLPRGEYTPVGPLDTSTSSYTAGVGLPLYLIPGSTTPTDGRKDPQAVFATDGAGTSLHNVYRLQSGVTRYTESYGVQTIYDGQTGAQPGVTYTVRVDKDDTTHTDPWYAASTTDGRAAGYNTHTSVGANPVYLYGPTPLYQGAISAGGEAEGYAIAGYGRVYQPEDDPSTTTVDESKSYTAIVRREGDQKDAQSVRVKLLSWDTEGVTRDPAGSTKYGEDNVVLVTYDTEQEGYTFRQTFTLTIKNVGTTDIYGLDIDTVTDGYDLKDNGEGTAKAGGHFEMLQPPASFLPVGSTTTFTLTYVYNLPANVAPNTLQYRDTLYITANGHNDPGPGKQSNTGLLTDDYLLDFDATFAVSKDPLHKVDVIYKPENGNMGTANLVVGEQGTSAADATMIYTPTTRTYPKDDKVYVVVNKVDEYEVKEIYITDANGNPITDPNDPTKRLTPVLYTGPADTDDMHPVYSFTMPDQDVIVRVDLYEPFYSKLRLEDLIDFSTPLDPDGSPPGTVNDLRQAATTVFAAQPPRAEHQYQVWRKSFTAQELADAAAWKTAAKAADADLYLMTKGRAVPHADTWPSNPTPTPEEEGQQFIPSENQYLVVIDADADRSQVEAKIRRIVYHEDYQGITPNNYDYGQNYEVTMSIDMEFYPYNVEGKTNNGYNWGQAGYGATAVYTSGGGSSTAAKGYGPNPAFTGTPNGITSVPPADPDDPTAPASDKSDSSIHTSVDFASPKPGESSYVVITLQAKDPADPSSSDTVKRFYYLEIHRKTAQPDVRLNYGNSPYGMIMNESRLDTDAKRDAAKEAFREGYTFQGMSKTLVPSVLWDNPRHEDMHYVTYWREAWAKNRALFEPESLTGFLPVRHADGCQKFYDEDPNDHDSEEKKNPLNIKSKPIYAPDPSVYDEADNLDLNDYAYFAILGEKLREPGVAKAWDSSGREVDGKNITAVAMDIDWLDNGRGVTLLDTAQTKQVARFAGNTTDFPVIDLGVQGRTLSPLPEHPATPPATTAVTKNDWPASSKEVTKTPDGGGDPYTEIEYTLIEDIRPGRYAIVYSFADFDGTTILQVDRPFVILREVGDVNSDGQRDNVSGAADATAAQDTDEHHIEDRVGTDPLGYEAGLAPNKLYPDGAVYPFANIFKYRVCDVNNDRNINHIDANQVDKNVTNSNSGWLRFYHPWQYGLPAT